jgi:hypothetical protein
MSRSSRRIRLLCQLACTLLALGVDTLHFLRLWLSSPAALAAENLFLRKQLALYQARHVKPKRATNATRFALVWLSRWFNWRPALAVVQPETFSLWRRQGGCLVWRWKSEPGRPPIPVELQALIRQMARDNVAWGQKRIANELRLKLGLRVSPRTVRKYVPNGLAPSPGYHVPSQRWRTFICNHAQALIVHGIAVDLLTRGAQAVSAWIRWLWHHWWGRSVTRGVQGTSQGYAGAIPLLRAIISVPIAWTADTGEAISMDERSPPDCGPSGTHDRCLAARDTSVDRFDVCPAGTASCWWNRANPHMRGVRPLRKGGSRVVPWCQAA